MLSGPDRRGVEQLRAELRGIDRPSRFGAAVVGEPLRALLRSSFFYAYDFVPAPAGRIEVGRCAMFDDEGGAHARRAELRLRAFVRSQPGFDWTTESPIRPSPSARNRAARVSVHAIPRTLPMVEYLRAADLPAHQCRVLVCEGPSLLAWVGAIRDTPFTPREAAILQAVTPDLLRRLRLERQLTGAAVPGLLDAVLETLGAPAFVLDSRLAIVHANACGIALWEEDPRGLADELVAELRGQPGSGGFELVPLRYPGMPPHTLALRRSAPASIDSRLASARTRWRLTTRQAETLGHVARGLTNKDVAAAMAVAENTVEFHVTALLEKAQVETRSALVAALWSLEP